MINIAQFNWFDYVLSILILISIILGLRQGFLKGLVSVLIWLAVLLVPLFFTDYLAIYLVKFIRSVSLAHFFSFIILAFGALVIGFLLYSIVRLLVGSGFDFIGSLFGIIFGLVRGILIMMLIVAAVSIIDFQQYQWFQQSQLVNFSQNIIGNLQVHTVKVTKKIHKMKVEH